MFIDGTCLFGFLVFVSFVQTVQLRIVSGRRDSAT